jgi:hypothetical protein
MASLPVHLTIDVENAEARRRGDEVRAPLGYGPRVWGRFRNRRDELGIRRLARDLSSRGLVATFYVEPLGARHFGADGLREVVACLLEHEQDVQLHLHPTQRDPEALLRGDRPPPDDMHAYPRDAQRALLREGLDRLVDAGVPRARLVAFRAGNFGANNETWLACRDEGLRLSSNYDPGYFDVSCAMRHEAARPDLFEPVEGLLELPISCVRTALGGLRHLQLTALSAGEIRFALERMRAASYAAATLVSHSFELYAITDRDGHEGRPIAVNERRWRALLDFLAANASGFPTETAHALVERALACRSFQALVPDGPAPPPPKTPPHLEALRFVEQAVKRVEPRLPAWLAPKEERSA